MSDLYLYDDVPVLRNKLGIKNEKALDLVEAEQSRANMMLLYERGFDDFSPDGLRTIHRTLFEDVLSHHQYREARETACRSERVVQQRRGYSKRSEEDYVSQPHYQ